MKTSLHRDGRCHTGFTSEYVKNNGPLSRQNRSRHLDQWVLPCAPAIQAAEILIPETELRVFPVKNPSKLKWLAPPVQNQLIGVLFVVAGKEVEIDWDNINPNLEPLGVIETNHRTLFIVFRRGSMTQEHHQQIKEKVRRAEMKISAEQKIGRRLILLGHMENGPRQFIELAWQ